MSSEAFSSIDLVAQCLIDEPRSEAFRAAIEKAVMPSSRVLDVGTGSGLLAMCAARAGALRVQAIELDPYVAETAERNIEMNKLSHKITLSRGDARSFEFPKETYFDVVIMEMLTTGMVDEFQVQAANNLWRQKVVSDATVFIPASQQTFLELTNKDFALYGFKFEMVQHLWNNLSENQKYSILSEKVLLQDIHFDRQNDECVEKVLQIIPTKSGTVNSIRLSSRTILADGIILDDTETFNAPVIVPVRETAVEKAVPVSLHLRYHFGGGYQRFFAVLR